MITGRMHASDEIRVDYALMALLLLLLSLKGRWSRSCLVLLMTLTAT